MFVYAENTEQTRNLEEQWMENTGETLPDGSKYHLLVLGNRHSYKRS